MSIPVDKKQIRTLTVKDLADLLGVSIEDIPQNCADIVSQSDFSFKLVDSRQKDEIVLMILKNINSGSLFCAGGKEGKKIWDKKWMERLVKFEKSGCNLTELTPEFFRVGDILRLHGDFVIARDPSFRLNFHKFLCRWVFQKYFHDISTVYEFGCGPALNLVELAQIYPGKTLYGLDWVRPIPDIIGLIAKKYGYNIHGGLFDMSSPNFDLAVKNNSAFFTSSALEQLGKNFQPYLDFVLAKSPDVVVDVNSFVDLYNQDNLLEYLAVMFNEKRNYLNGYITVLRELEKKKKIIIHKICKVQLGTLYHNNFSYVVWSPIKMKR